ncbi:hypothetical protein CA11_09730 [Gimesia maris]|uniref:hypothetical protein n=1 Tax=Gimesia maris TaxID=122 RepID=UPI00118C56B6|nr:hypothetical protein [Gimesia maris]QDU13191.1 hypothetical protein CA11_09730 [Gimesia maris]
MTMDDYYKSIDLLSLIQGFDNTDPERAKNIFYIHAVEAFERKCEIEELVDALLLKVCGKPDEVIHCEDFDVWIYLWYAWYGYEIGLDIIIRPFKIQSNRVRFLELDEIRSLENAKVEIINKYGKAL